MGYRQSWGVIFWKLHFLTGVHKTGIRGIQNTRQIVDGETNDIENNNKQAGAELCQAKHSLS